MEYTIDAGAALARLADISGKLRGSEVRLLVKLTAMALAGGKLEVTANERQIRGWLQMGTGQLWRAKRHLAELALVYHESTAGHRTGVWYLQYLRDLVSASVSEARVPPFQRQGASVSEAGASVLEARVPPFQRQGASVLEAGASVLEAASTDGYSHDQDGLARARRSIEAVVSNGSFSSIDRVLQTKIWTAENDEAVGILARYLRSWAARDGAPGLAERTLDRQILAQCAAIGPIGVLESAWLNISDRLGGYKVTSWGFFVTALLAEVHGFTPTQVKERRAALRHGAGSATAVDSTHHRNLLLSKLVHGVKSLA